MDLRYENPDELFLQGLVKLHKFAAWLNSRKSNQMRAYRKSIASVIDECAWTEAEMTIQAWSSQGISSLEMWRKRMNYILDVKREIQGFLAITIPTDSLPKENKAANKAVQYCDSMLTYAQGVIIAIDAYKDDDTDDDE